MCRKGKREGVSKTTNVPRKRPGASHDHYLNPQHLFSRHYATPPRPTDALKPEEGSQLRPQAPLYSGPQLPAPPPWSSRPPSFLLASSLLGWPTATPSPLKQEPYHHVSRRPLTSHPKGRLPFTRLVPPASRLVPLSACARPPYPPTSPTPQLNTMSIASSASEDGWVPQVYDQVEKVKGTAENKRTVCCVIPVRSIRVLAEVVRHVALTSRPSPAPLLPVRHWIPFGPHDLLPSTDLLSSLCCWRLNRRPESYPPPPPFSRAEEARHVDRESLFQPPYPSRQHD